MKECPYCGKQIPNSTRVCVFCAKEIKPKGRSDLTLIIVLFSVISCLVVAIIYINPVNDYPKAIKTEEVAKSEENYQNFYLPLVYKNEQIIPITGMIADIPTVELPTPTAIFLVVPTATRYIAPTATNSVSVPPTKHSEEISNCINGCPVHISGCDIKGNISFKTGERIYHVPGGEFYNATEINPRYGERWFCTEEEARQAGWRKSYR
jgi:predicted nucleic acid-binding Zn ribbon protein